MRKDRNKVLVIRRDWADDEGVMPPSSIRRVLRDQDKLIAVISFESNGGERTFVFIPRLRKDADRLGRALGIQRTAARIKEALTLTLGSRSREYKLVVPAGYADEQMLDSAIVTAGLTALVIARR